MKNSKNIIYSGTVIEQKSKTSFWACSESFTSLKEAKAFIDGLKK